MRRTVTRRPVAPAFADAGADPAGTQHADADAERLELRRPASPTSPPPRTCSPRRAPIRAPLSMPAIDAVLTMWPPSPWLWMCGRKAATPCTTPIRLMSITQRQSSIGDAVDAAAAGDAGIVADHMDLAERRERVLRRGSTRRGRPRHRSRRASRADARSCRRRPPAPRPRCRRASPACRPRRRRGRARARCRWRRRSRMPSCPKFLHDQFPASMLPPVTPASSCSPCMMTLRPLAPFR